MDASSAQRAERIHLVLQPGPTNALPQASSCCVCVWLYAVHMKEFVSAQLERRARKKRQMWRVRWWGKRQCWYWELERCDATCTFQRCSYIITAWVDCKSCSLQPGLPLNILSIIDLSHRPTWTHLLHTMMSPLKLCRSPSAISCTRQYVGGRWEHFWMETCKRFEYPKKHFANNLWKCFFSAVSFWEGV